MRLHHFTFQRHILCSKLFAQPSFKTIPDKGNFVTLHSGKIFILRHFLQYQSVQTNP